MKEGYFDAEAGRIFMIDEQGELTGETAKAELPPIAKTQELDKGADAPSKKKEKPKKEKKPKKPKKAKKEPEPPPEEEEYEEEDEEEYEEDEYDRQPKKKKGGAGKTLAIVGIIVVILAALLFYFIQFGVPAGLSNILVKPTPTPVPTPIATAEPSPTPLLADVVVVQTIRDIFKGEQITADALQEATITAGEYNTLITGGNAPCKWDELNTINGLYANQYIPSGAYIGDSVLAATDPILPNPWAEIGDGYQTLALSPSLIQGSEVPFFGAEVTVKVSKMIDMTAEAPEAAPDLSWPEDAEGENPYSDIYVDEEYTDDTYTMLKRDITVYGATICDILNVRGESIYSQYMPYVDMPTVNRLQAITAATSAADAYDTLHPASIIIKMSSEELNALGSLSNATVTLALTGNADGSTDDKYNIAWGTQAIADSIDELLANAQPAAEAAVQNAVPADVTVPVDVTVTPVPEEPQAPEADAGYIG